MKILFQIKLSIQILISQIFYFINPIEFKTNWLNIIKKNNIKSNNNQPQSSKIFTSSKSFTPTSISHSYREFNSSQPDTTRVKWSHKCSFEERKLATVSLKSRRDRVQLLRATAFRFGSCNVFNILYNFPSAHGANVAHFGNYFRFLSMEQPRAHPQPTRNNFRLV